VQQKKQLQSKLCFGFEPGVDVVKQTIACFNRVACAEADSRITHTKVTFFFNLQRNSSCQQLYRKLGRDRLHGNTETATAADVRPEIVSAWLGWRNNHIQVQKARFVGRLLSVNALM